MAAAYSGLPDSVKNRIASLYAVHDPLTIYDGYDDTTRLRDARGMFPANIHPVVRLHPESGERILYVNRLYTTRILGIEESESSELLNYLCDRAQYPEYQVRLNWKTGTVAVWDNRSTQHYAVSDYYPQPRRLERVSIRGDTPRGERRPLPSVRRRDTCHADG
jgi:taurine dioxygenase